MTVNYSITPGQKLTENEKEEIRKAKELPIQFDEDCPEMSEKMLKSLRAAVFAWEMPGKRYDVGDRESYERVKEGINVL